MKKLYYSFTILLILFGLLTLFTPKRFFGGAEQTESEEVIWAQIKTPAELYEKNGEDFTPVVTLPATYFVALLEDFDNTEHENYILSSYLDIIGYISVANLATFDGEPVTKYATPAFTASNEGLSAILRSSPDHNADNTLALIPDGEKLLYYGTAAGSSRYEGASTVWYYVKYSGGEDPLFGYVYSYHGIADPIPENKVEKVEKPAPEIPPEPMPTPEEKHLSGAAQTVFIVCLCVPAALIMFMLFRRAPEDKKKKKPRGFEG